MKPMSGRSPGPRSVRAWAPGEPLAPGLWDIPVPPETAPEVIPDVLLVPMLAFDRRGYRLGYGGGFYDRTLEKLRALKKVTAVGVAYHAQMADDVAVMHRGIVVESGDVRSVLKAPQHAYTRSLLDALPSRRRPA